MSVTRRDLLVAGVAAGAGLLGANLHAGRRRQQRPNVLVIVLDTVRADRVGRTPSLTPRLDRFIARGTRFTNAWAHDSWSLPSHATILTGRLPHQHGADWPGLRLARATPTIAEVLAAHGYVCGAFSSNSAWVTPEYLAHGFARFRAYSIEDHLRRTTWGRVANRLSEPLGLHAAGRGRKAPVVQAEVLRFLERYPDRPFFAYVCHMDANQAFHHAKLNHPAWRDRPSVSDIVAAYDRAMTLLDAQVGAFLDELDARGLLQQTLVVMTSDHGESFGAANPGDHDPEGHGSSLYPEQTAVPLAVIPPGGLTEPRVVDRLVGLASIPATIAQALGIGGAPFGSAPVLPLHPAWEAGLPAEPVVVQTLNYADRRARALVTPRWTWMHELDAGRERLFDRLADPGCTNDLGAGHEVVPGLRDRFLRESGLPAA